MIMGKKELSMLIVLGVLSGFCFGMSSMCATHSAEVLIEKEIEVRYEPVEITKLVEREKIVEVPKLVEIETVVKVPVEVEVPAQLNEFSSIEELEEWLEKNDVDHVLHGVGVLNLAQYDCEDYAQNLAKQAIKDGYYMWVQVLHHPYRRPDTGKILTKFNVAHTVCSAIIGNNWYYIEPQTDEYWLAVKVD
ncbi:hypothetical protein ACFLWC_00730 [Chloroflexota bacterium]